MYNAFVDRIKMLFLCFTLGIFLMSAGLGLIFGQSDTAISLITHAPIFNPPVSQTPLSPGRIIELVNQKRAEEDLPQLVRDPSLDFVAYIRAVNIIKNSDFSHEAAKSGGLTFNNVADRLLAQYQFIGENLALGDFDGEEKTLVTAWLDSSVHKEIILGNYDKVGVFTINGEFNGVPSLVTVWITVKK